MPPKASNAEKRWSNLTPAERNRRAAQSRKDKAGSGSRGVRPKSGAAQKGFVRNVELKGFSWNALGTQGLRGSTRLAGDLTVDESKAMDLAGSTWTLEGVKIVLTKRLTIEPYKFVAYACMTHGKNVSPSKAECLKEEGNRKVAGTGDGGDVVINLPFRKGDPRVKDVSLTEVLSVHLLVEMAGGPDNPTTDSKGNVSGPTLLESTTWVRLRYTEAKAIH